MWLTFLVSIGAAMIWWVTLEGTAIAGVGFEPRSRTGISVLGSQIEQDSVHAPDQKLGLRVVTSTRRAKAGI